MKNRVYLKLHPCIGLYRLLRPLSEEGDSLKLVYSAQDSAISSGWAPTVTSTLVLEGVSLAFAGSGSPWLL